jgi:branched-chain amino acid aminotransferase
MTQAWFNGGFLDLAAVHVRPDDRGFTLGDGLFETLRIQGGAAPLLDRHLDRLVAGCDLLGLPLPFDRAALADAILGTAARNGLGDAAVRLTLTAGPAPRGLPRPALPAPTVLITAAAAPPPGGPVRAVIARCTRRNEHSPLSRIKSLNYLDNVLARQEAAARGADDALLLNGAGRLAEATAANLFLELDGVLVTPPVADGALPGVARGELLRAGAVERSLVPDDLRRCTRAFLTNSLGRRDLVEVDGRPLGRLA